MTIDPAQLYRDLGTTPVINASGNMTVLGGSRVSPKVQEAMVAANRHFISMDDLLRTTGERIAELLDAEAAMVTPGCGAALALSSAACMSVGNPERMEQLPNVDGIPNRFLFQRRQHYHYERCLTIFGGQILMVGSEQGTSEGELEDAVTEQTAAIHYYASGDPDDTIQHLSDIQRIASRHGLPITVDAAYQVYPLQTMKNYAQATDCMIGFGAKYIGACNSTGILAGRKDLVEAAYAHSFIGFETSDFETLGRPLKLDRQEIVAVVVALEEWLTMDHDARLAEHWRRADYIQEQLADTPHIATERHVEDNSLSNGVLVTVDESALGKSTPNVIKELKQGDPSIWVRGFNNRFRIAVDHPVEDEIDTVISRLKFILMA